jgi:uncharacterized membrane protein
MLEDACSFEHVIGVSFVKEASVNDALARVQELDAKGAIGVRNAAVVVSKDDGKFDETKSIARRAARSGAQARASPVT